MNPGAELGNGYRLVLDALYGATTGFLAVDLDDPHSALAAGDAAVAACRTAASPCYSRMTHISAKPLTVSRFCGGSSGSYTPIHRGPS